MRLLSCLLAFTLLPFTAFGQEINCPANADPLPYFNKVLNKNKSKIVAKKTNYKTATLSVYPARVLYVQGRVEIVAQQVGTLENPLPLTAGAVLHLGDVLQTHEQSFISLRLGDGTISTLPSNSRIELGRSSPSVARFVLQKGTVESAVLKKNKPSKNTFEIQIPNAIVGVRGTRFRVHYEQGQSYAEVTDGTIWIQPRQICRPPIVMTVGEGVRLDNLSTAAPARLLPAPQLLMPGNAQKNSSVEFKVTPVVGAVRYHVQVANDEDFLDVQLESFSDTPDVRLTEEIARNGFYYAKFTAIDNTGLEGVPSAYFFLRAFKSE